MFSSLIAAFLVAAGGAVQQQDAPAAFATVEGDQIHITFDEQDGTPLVEFLEFARSKFDLPLEWRPIDTKDVMLRSQGTTTVPCDGFFGYLQNVLRAHDYLLAPYGTVALPGHPAPDGAATGFLAVRTSSFQGAGGKPGYVRSMAPLVGADMLDVYRDDSGMVLTTSFQLQQVSVQDAMNMLQSYFMDPMLEGVRGVPDSNTLVATGFAPTLLMVRDLLRLIDVPPPAPGERQLARFELRHAAAIEAKSVVEGLLCQSPQAGAEAQGPRPLPAVSEPEVRIEADARTNALLVLAGPSTLARIEECLAQIDIPLEPTNERTQVVRLELTNASNLAETLRAWAAGIGLERQVSVVADHGSNSLLITAEDATLERVLTLVKQLDAKK